MKTRESWLQNGIFIYKTGLSVTKQDFHLQNRILELQTGLSPCYLPVRVSNAGRQAYYITKHMYMKMLAFCFLTSYNKSTRKE